MVGDGTFQLLLLDWEKKIIFLYLEPSLLNMQNGPQNSQPMKPVYPKTGLFLFTLLIPLQIVITFLVFISQSQVTSPESAYVKVTDITTLASTSTLTFDHINQTYHPFTKGEAVIIIQMQDDVAGSNTVRNASAGTRPGKASAGLFEAATIAEVTSTTMTLTSALHNSYSIGSNASVRVVNFSRLDSDNIQTYTSSPGGKLISQR